MKCLHVGCPLEATERGACPVHHHWAAVILADPRYQTEQAPASPRPNPDGSMQAVLL